MSPLNRSSQVWKIALWLCKNDRVKCNTIYCDRKFSYIMILHSHILYYSSITIYDTAVTQYMLTLPEIGLQINYFNTKKLVKISLFILILFTVANRVLLKKFTRSTMDNPEPLSFRGNKWEGSMPFLLLGITMA